MRAISGDTGNVSERREDRVARLSFAEELDGKAAMRFVLRMTRDRQHPDRRRVIADTYHSSRSI
ncbi:hypothetical protein [Bradyrhizobium sp. 25ACV]